MPRDVSEEIFDLFDRRKHNSAMILTTTSSIVAIPNIKITSPGTKYISFYSSNQSAIALYTKLSTGVSWSVEYLDPYVVGGAFTSLAGQSASLVLNASEYPLAFYRSKENWLKYFSREAL